ncbi:hypothetical protein H8M03_00110 [Sphingomonas sabuli]|uniref:Uncharacterized protein n=1 Tax=Sphingomonas sabuli TaxID=2764186 RepID=A0A7G9L2G9_9SPHN|nr:hypothetical protein [Sphingomonas sabuli]QNM82818.1 hypothetical protein H8M03_00110 [Sphingomonas sabuli]
MAQDQNSNNNDNRSTDGQTPNEQGKSTMQDEQRKPGETGGDRKPEQGSNDGQQDKAGAEGGDMSKDKTSKDGQMGSDKR